VRRLLCSSSRFAVGTKAADTCLTSLPRTAIGGTPQLNQQISSEPLNNGTMAALAQQAPLLRAHLDRDTEDVWEIESERSRPELIVCGRAIRRRRHLKGVCVALPWAGTESDSKNGGVPVPVQMWAGGEPSRGADAKGARDSRGSLRCRESIVSVRLSSVSRRSFHSTFGTHARSARCSHGAAVRVLCCERTRLPLSSSRDKKHMHCMNSVGRLRVIRPTPPNPTKRSARGTHSASEEPAAGAWFCSSGSAHTRLPSWYKMQ
jgi:hypothetical protein